MKKMRGLLSFAMAAALMTFAASAQAAPISFWSGDGGDALTGGLPGAVTEVSNLHPAWGDVSGAAGLSDDTAKWISYADTGIGGVIAPNAADRTEPNATSVFSRTFDIGANGDFNLWILADDTATVKFSGPGIGTTTLFSAFLGQINPCAPGGSGIPIGCVNADMGVASLSGLAAGLYTLEVFVFQTNLNVFGTQYAGDYTPAVPEPTSMVLLGTGLLGLAARARKKFRARS